MSPTALLQTIANEYDTGHPVRISCIKAMYDVQCLEAIKWYDIDELRRSCTTSAYMDQERFNMLYRDMQMIDKQINDTLDDVRSLVLAYEGRSNDQAICTNPKRGRQCTPEIAGIKASHAFEP